MHVLMKVEGKILYFFNLSASQLKCSFRYAKEIIQPACILWLVFLRLNVGPLIVMVCLAVKVLVCYVRHYELFQS